MNVLYISDPGTVGGAARALLEVVSHVQKFGVRPIVCTSVYNEFNKQLESMGIKNISIGHYSAMNTRSPYKWKRPIKYPYESIRYYLSLPKAIHTIEESIDIKKIDIIHTNSARNDIGCFLNKKYNIPHIMHIREFGQEDFNCCVYRPHYYDFISRYSSRLLAISNAVADSWIDKGVDKNKLQVLYDGVDIESIKYKNPEEDHSESLRMIIAGGICEPKGQHIAIEAFKYLDRSIIKKIFLDIAGWSDPRYEDKLKRIIHELHIEDQITFLGLRNDLYKLYNEYDIGLTCSKCEGFGRVTAEYLYAGLGVIGSNTGATPELVKNNQTGLLFQYPDSKSLAMCIERFFFDRSLLLWMGSNAHNDAQKYSAGRNAKEIFSVYKDVLNGES